MDLEEFEIISHNSEFDFKTINLEDPTPLTGHAGFYFTPITVKGNKSLCLQLPTCVTKQGIVLQKPNTKYTDLMFERSQHDELMRWVEQLEYRCQDLIDDKKELWFQTEITRDDIETMMSQITRLYQSGKYVLMRVFIDVNKTGGNSKCIAYDANEIGVDLDTLTANKEIIPLVMIEGVKFSSRSFEIVLKLTQVMVLDKTASKKTNCLIKPLQTTAPASAATLAASLAAPALEEPPAPLAVQSPAPASAVQEPKQENIPEDTNSSLDTINIVIVEKEPVVPIISNPLPLEINNIEDLGMHEVTIQTDKLNNEPITLRKPNEVYYEVYKKARDKAKKYRLLSLEAYLESKQIRTRYMLEDINDSDDDELFEQTINSIEENDNDNGV